MTVLEVPYVPTPELGALLFADDFAAVRKARHETANTALNRLVAENQSADLEIDVHISHNTKGVHNEILAEVTPGDWVCISTHHQNRLLAKLMGSVSLSLAQNAKCPVVFIPRGYDPNEVRRADMPHV